MLIYSTRIEDSRFELRKNKGKVLSGFIDEAIINRVSKPVLKALDSFQGSMGVSAKETRDLLKNEIGDDLPNFSFISSLLDYGNIGASENLHLVMKDLHERMAFLFRPKDPFWAEYEKRSAPDRTRVLGSRLIRLSGMFRTDFDNVVVSNWAKMIRFLREKCEGDASNFFLYCCSAVGVDPANAEALIMVLEKLSNKDSARNIGIDFGWVQKYRCFSSKRCLTIEVV